MSLRKIDATFDLLEAHIIVARLRNEGIDAEVFDASFVRQNWLRAIAYGGFRIMVRDSDFVAARELIAAYRKNTVALADAADPPCPNCGSTRYSDDPQPRRIVFATIFATPFLEFMLLLVFPPSQVLYCFAVGTMLFVFGLLPLLLIPYFKHRFRCLDCGHRWRGARTFRFAELDRQYAASFGPPA